MPMAAVIHLSPRTAGRITATPNGLSYVRRRTSPEPVVVDAGSTLLACARWNNPDASALAAWWRRGGMVALTRGSMLAAMPVSAHGPSPTQMLLRRHQHRRSRDPAWTEALAARLVNAKILAQRQVLGHHLRQRPEDAVILKTCRELDALRTALPGQRGMSAIRGLEGQAARTYFAAWPTLGGLTDFARQARTGADHLNLLLDITYAHLCILVSLELIAQGADLGLGALHADDGSRPTLALDLMEPLRPVVADRFILHQWLHAQHASWFTAGTGGRCWEFTTTGRRCWRERWTTWIHGGPRRPGQYQRIAGTVRTWVAALAARATPPSRWPQLHDAGGRW